MIRLAFIACGSLFAIFLAYAIGFRNGWKSYARIKGRQQRPTQRGRGM